MGETDLRPVSHFLAGQPHDKPPSFLKSRCHSIGLYDHWVVIPWLVMQVCTCVHTHTHIFHPAVDGHFGCFRILATATNSAVSMECRYRFKIVSSFRLDHRSGISGWYGNLFSIFRGPPILFSTVDISTYILTDRVQGFPFLQSCQCCLSFNFLMTATLSCGVVVHCGWSALPWWLVSLSIFSYTYPAGVQPRRIQGIRSGDCVGEDQETIA